MESKEQDNLQKLLLDFTDLPSLEAAFDKAHAKIEDRISYIVENATVRGAPVVKMILQYTDDPKELEMLSKALARIAEIMPQLEEVETKRSLIKGLSQERGWLASQLGNFSEDIDPLIARILESERAS